MGCKILLQNVSFFCNVTIFQMLVLVRTLIYALVFVYLWGMHYLGIGLIPLTVLLVSCFGCCNFA